MSKPTIDLYIGEKVIAVVRGDEDWEWGLKLESGVEIRNKNEDDTMRPMGVVNARIQTISQSSYDTTIHLRRPDSLEMIHIGFKPAAYTICDPRYGDEVYPQWPEELDEMGITANEGKAEISPEPDDPEAWKKEELRRASMAERRHIQSAQEFLKEEE